MIGATPWRLWAQMDRARTAITYSNILRWNNTIARSTVPTV